jgi:hypothetical protein
MSTEACPHCHEQVHKTDDGCMARRAFVRQSALAVWQFAEEKQHFKECWEVAEMFWNAKPEGC